MHLLPLKPEALFKIFWTHVCNTRYQPRVSVLAFFRAAFIRASFLGVQPSECQKYTEKTFARAWAILPSLLGIGPIVPSSTPTTAPRLLSNASKTPPDVCLRSSLPAVSSVFLSASCCARCKPPSFLGLFVELLLHFPPSSICAQFQRKYHTFLGTFSYVALTLMHGSRRSLGENGQHSELGSDGLEC